MARRLLDDTDLPITDVAFVVGFGSLRQFNRDMLRVFRDTPTGLRRRRRRRDRLSADGGLILRIVPPSDFRWEAALNGLEQQAVPGVATVIDGVYRRTLTVQGDAGAVEIVGVPPGAVRVTLHLPHLEELVHIVAAVRGLLGLSRFGVSRSASLPAPRAQPPGTWSQWEADVVAAIMSTASSGTANDQLSALVAAAGKPVHGLSSWGLTHTFPTPEQLAQIDSDQLGISAACSTAVAAIASKLRRQTV